MIARQIGKMLNGKEPKVVNGPEILNKYVGASEENVRNLFKARTTASPQSVLSCQNPSICMIIILTIVHKKLMPQM